MRWAWAVVAVATSAAGQVPLKVGYQGFLRAVDGGVVTGLKELTFAIYESPEGGSPRWSEAQPVLLKDGHYTLTLGDASGCDGGPCSGIPADVFSSSADLYLELTVEGQPFRPRQRVTSAPFAITALQLRGGSVQGTSASFTGAVQAASGNFSGPVLASGATIAGPVQAATVTATGDVQAANVTASGQLTGAGLRTAGGVQVINATGAYVAPTQLIYLCPLIASDAQCRAGSCLGQLTNRTSCTNYQYVNAACDVRTAACPVFGRVLP